MWKYYTTADVLLKCVFERHPEELLVWQPLIFWCDPSPWESDNCATRYDFVNTNLLRGGAAGFRETGCHPPISFLSSLFLILSHPRGTVSYFIWWVCGAAALWDKNTRRISTEPLWSEPKLGWDNECTLTHTHTLWKIQLINGYLVIQLFIYY